MVTFFFKLGSDSDNQHSTFIIIIIIIGTVHASKAAIPSHFYYRYFIRFWNQIGHLHRKWIQMPVTVVLHVKAILRLLQTTPVSATRTLLEHNSSFQISDHNVKSSSAAPSH
jgi:hypothetical protein